MCTGPATNTTKLSRYALFLTFLLALPASAQSDAWGGPFPVTGYGYKYCGEFSQAARRERPHMGTMTQAGLRISESTLFVEWAYGYITAINSARAGGELVGGLVDVPPAVLVTWLENYCAQKPRERFISAASKLVQELSQRK